MKAFTLLVFAILSIVGCTPIPEKENWVNLFNGANLDGWDIKISGHELNENFNNTFIVEDSII